MKQITIGFSKSSEKFGFFSWLIMWAQGCNYSHAYLKHQADWGNRNVYYQASGMSVNYMSEELFLSKETVVQEFQFTVSDDKFNKMQDFCLENSAKPYGIKSIFGFAYVIIAGKLGFKVHNPVRDASSSPVCSELVAELLADLDVPIPMAIDDITPKDLFPIVQALPSDLSGGGK